MPERILIDIGHPAHVHLFKNFAAEMVKSGNRIYFTCRSREFVEELLTHYGFSYSCFGKSYKTRLGKIIGLFKFTILIFFQAIKTKPTIFLSHSSMYAAFVAFILRRPHISFEDTGNWEQIRLYLPFTEAVLTSTCFPHLFGKKQVFYNGYHELAYLHPRRFVPDNAVLRELGVGDDEPYVILRFVSMIASHDFGHRGISYQNRVAAVNHFSKFARVFISSESELPSDLEKHRFSLPPNRIHHAIAFASLLYGESATMASEAAMLGVPAIFLNKNKFHTISEQEKKFGLLVTFSESDRDQVDSIVKGIELINCSKRKSLWMKKRDQMLSEVIDVTAFLIWFIKEYPQSKQILLKNPEFLNEFK